MGLCSGHSSYGVYLLGIMSLWELKDVASIAVKNNNISMSFSEYGRYENYIYSYVGLGLDNLEITGKNQKFDVGYSRLLNKNIDKDYKFLQFWGPVYKYTLKYDAKKRFVYP